MSNDYLAQYFEPYRCLWNADDKAWVKTRKAEWSELVKGPLSRLKGEERKVKAAFYVTGEYISYIHGATRYLCMPNFDSTLAGEIFWSKAFSGGGRRELLSQYFSIAPQYVGMHWFQQHLAGFKHGIHGETFRVIKEKDGEVLSRSAASWCMSYTGDMRDLMSGEISYSPYLEFRDYFISALPNAESSDLRFDVAGSLYRVVDAVLSDDSRQGLAREIAEDLKSMERDVRKYLSP